MGRKQRLKTLIQNLKIPPPEDVDIIRYVQENTPHIGSTLFWYKYLDLEKYCCMVGGNVKENSPKYVNYIISVSSNNEVNVGGHVMMSLAECLQKGVPFISISLVFPGHANLLLIDSSINR